MKIRSKVGSTGARRPARSSHLATAASIVLAAFSAAAIANGAWNGQDVLHVPISWCVLGGSPAQANPNLAGDTDTDAILWRRHERPTDNIYINPAGISFRSAINNAWGTFNFPQVTDTDTILGTQGDVRGEDVNANGVEFNQLINDCDAAYTNLGRAGIGVTAVNVGLFHDANGDYVGVIGWGGCAEFPAGTCAAPFDGRIMVIDNQYLHPASADRTFPPSPADPAGNLRFVITDSLDQLTGHELGHALSLDHRNVLTALMNPGLADNDGNGDGDNFALNNQEVNSLRTNSLNVPGLETDPPGVFIPGRFNATRVPDETQEDRELPAYLDLASLRVSLDKEAERLFFDAQLFGLIPENHDPLALWYLIDVDGPDEGFDPDRLGQLGVPPTSLRGPDLVGQVIVRGRQVVGESYILEGREEVIRVDDLDRVLYQLHTLVMHPHFAPISGQGGELPRDVPAPVHDIVRLDIANEFVRVQQGVPFQVEVLVTLAGGDDALDTLAREGQEGVEFVLDDPTFPHCFPGSTARPGDVIPMELEGLLPNEPIHGLLGPTLVFNGTTDASGGGTIDFPIPTDAVLGYHLVTIGVDGTALTADCTVEVVRGEPAEGPDDKYELLRSHEDLLRRQQELLDHFATFVRDLRDSEGVTEDQLLQFTELYGDLVARQQALLERFEEMIMNYQD